VLGQLNDLLATPGEPPFCRLEDGFIASIGGQDSSVFGGWWHVLRGEQPVNYLDYLNLPVTVDLRLRRTRPAPALATARIQQAAAAGGVVLQKWLGDLYRLGHGLPRDPQQALTWYQRAADQGSTVACYNLGITYLFEPELAAAAQEGLPWISQAAREGFAPAQTLIAWFLQRGEHLARDLPEAARRYEQAVAQGDPQAMEQLGQLLLFGRGVPQDVERAERLLAEAARRGNGAAADHLGRLQAGKNPGASARWYARATDLGHEEAPYRLALRYLGGRGVPMDRARAIELLQLAAGRGSAGAAYELGQLEVQARPGVAGAGLSWFRRAARLTRRPELEITMPRDQDLVGGQLAVLIRSSCPLTGVTVSVVHRDGRAIRESHSATHACLHRRAPEGSPWLVEETVTVSGFQRWRLPRDGEWFTATLVCDQGKCSCTLAPE
jgi:TPR repeat protein